MAWAEVLGDREAGAMMTALRELSLEMTFPPSIAEIVERADEIAGVGWLVAWRAVLADVGSNAATARRALPESAYRATRLALERMGGWPLVQHMSGEDVGRRRREFREHYLAAERELAESRNTPALPEYADYEVIADYSRR